MADASPETAFLGEYEKLKRFVIRSRGRFALALVRSNLADGNISLLDRLKRDIEPEGLELIVIDARSRVVKSLFDELSATVSDRHSDRAPCVAFIGLEGSLARKPGTDLTPDLAVSLNVQRDSLVGRFNFPVLLWLTDTAMDVLKREAPDFADFYSGLFVFRTLPFGSTGIIQMDIGGEQPVSGPPLSPHTMRERMDILHDMLRDAEGESRADLLRQLGDVHWQADERQAALKYYEDALELSNQFDNPREKAVVLNKIGLAWHALGEPKKAKKYYEPALEIRREKLGEKHPNVAQSLNNLGLAWHALGEPKKAKKYFEQALLIWREALGDRHPEVATTLNNLGSAWYALGEPKKAVEYYEQALSIIREALGEKHPNVATTLNNLGGAWQDLGEYDRAVEYFKQALEIDLAVFGEENPQTAIHMVNLGRGLLYRGEVDQALGLIARARGVFAAMLGDEHPYTQQAVQDLVSAVIMKEKGVPTLGELKKLLESMSREEWDKMAQEAVDQAAKKAKESQPPGP